LLDRPLLRSWPTTQPPGYDLLSCISPYACILLITHTHTHTRTHTSKHKQTHTHTRAHTHTYTHIFTMQKRTCPCIHEAQTHTYTLTHRSPTPSCGPVTSFPWPWGTFLRECFAWPSPMPSCLGAWERRCKQRSTLQARRLKTEALLLQLTNLEAWEKRCKQRDLPPLCKRPSSTQS